MKKWFLSQDGELTGPLTEAEAIAYLQDKPNSYGWHPTFSQWLPVSHIAEFVGRVPAVESPAKIPKELIDGFNTKRTELQHTFGAMDESIKYTKTYLYELEQEINIYKRLTNKLSDEVKQGIGGIESTYQGYQKVLEDLVYAVSMAKVEMEEVTAEFDQRLLEREKDLASAPAAPQAVLNTAASLGLALDPVAVKAAAAPVIPAPALAEPKTVQKDPLASAAKDAAEALKLSQPAAIEFDIEPPAAEPEVVAELVEPDAVAELAEPEAVVSAPIESETIELEVIEPETIEPETIELEPVLPAAPAKAELELVGDPVATSVTPDAAQELVAQLEPVEDIQAEIKPEPELKPEPKPEPKLQVVQDAVASKPAAAETVALDPVAAKPAAISKIAPPLDIDPVAAKPAQLDPIAPVDPIAAPVDPIAAPVDPVAAPLDPVAAPAKAAAVSLDPVATKADPNDFFAELTQRSQSLDPVASRPPAGMDKLLFGFSPEEFGAASGDAKPAPLAEVPKAELPADAEPLASADKQADNKADNKAKFSEQPEGDEDGKNDKGEPLAKLQAVTSIFKSVFKGEKKDEIRFLSESEAGPGAAQAEDAAEPELAEVSADKPKETQPKEVKNDIEGRMRRRSRRRG
ncbi:GYF domain-containing protein [Shewanella sp. 3B26]|uniref:GYF domain-containing protein n=1 Tax=Shewanella zhuhaiensis TaxID=2919576 RepID=A0AAJ1BJ68_9GAMM|nr:GYF domain-containing protein [Shewanella zhuhaiensis]MCH4294902.1 GYF domain-containing protein [Shewanella zhuhaiensis]